MSMPTDLHAQLRRVHEQQVLGALRSGGPMTRSELAAATAISRTTMSEIVAGLLDRAVIVVAAATERPARRGRPAERLALSPRAGQVLGIDFGHRRVRVVVVDAAHRVVASARGDYSGSADWPRRTAVLDDVLERVAQDPEVELKALRGVGVGLPGPYSPRMPAVPTPGTAEDGPTTGRPTQETVSSWVADLLARRFSAPVVVDNNTRFAALAEASWGVGREARDLVYVRIADGVGGGLVIDGRLVSGSGGFAGELGHISVMPDGPTCRCGKRGCIEMLVSVPALLARCTERGVAVADLAELAAAAEAEDPVIDRVLREAGEALGRVLGTMAVALNPAEVVVGGDIVRAAPALLAQATAALGWELLPVQHARPTIRAARLGDDAGALGAVVATLHASALLHDYPETGVEPVAPIPQERTTDAS